MPKGGSVFSGSFGGAPSVSARSSGSFFSNLNYGQIVQGIGDIISSGEARDAGRIARDIARQNAEDMLALAGENAARMQQIAGINASAIRKTGYANAAALERAAVRNGQLIILEGAETLRRHVRMEQYRVGDIRARQAATGWSVNEGTLVLYKEHEKAEMFRSRRYTAQRQRLSLFTMLQNTKDQAEVQRYAADQSAGALLASAALEREIMQAEAAAEYARMIREGELAYISGQQAGGGTSGIGALIGTIGGSFLPIPGGSIVGGAIGDFLEGSIF